MSLLETLQKEISPLVRAEESMSRHTTYKLGGPAEYFIEATTSEIVSRALAAAHNHNIPTFVFGGGSNLVVADAGISGLVIKMTNRGFQINAEKAQVVAEAGAPTGLVSLRATEAGLTGFEWAVGLPGTIGGAVRGNGGMFGGEMKDSVSEIRVMHDGQEKTLTASECDFAYRSSIIKKDPSYIVLSATLQLAQSPDPEAGKAKLREYLLEKKAKQPIEFACAGCIFTNWQPPTSNDLTEFRQIMAKVGYDSVPVTPQGTVPAGWIMDKLGLAGTSVGGLTVSTKHANFFVNDGTGTTDQLLQLIALIKTRVRNATNGIVQLHEEVEVVGLK
jgi:UDP-N-acetylmuramate dehydrogenase